MTEACAICGEPIEDDDDHGHFDTSDVPCTICGTLPQYHTIGPGDKALMEKAHWTAGWNVDDPNIVWGDHDYESGI